METQDKERELLLGYLLNALDDREADHVREELAHNPHLQSKLAALQRELSPLDYIGDTVEPPPQLANRTCSKIWKTLDGGEKANQDSVLGMIYDPYKTMVAMNAVELDLPKVSKKTSTPQTLPKTSHWLGLVVSVSLGVVVAFFLFPMIKHAERTTRSIATDNWATEIGRRVDSYEQIHGTLGSAPAVEEMLPLNLALHAWQELPHDALMPSFFWEFFLGIKPSVILPDDIIRRQQSVLFSTVEGLNETTPLDLTGVPDDILLWMPSREGSVRSAFGRDILLKDGRVFLRTLPVTEPPKQ